jgi:hypothetical protein
MHCAGARQRGIEMLGICDEGALRIMRDRTCCRVESRLSERRAPIIVQQFLKVFLDIVLWRRWPAGPAELEIPGVRHAARQRARLGAAPGA